MRGWDRCLQQLVPSEAGERKRESETTREREIETEKGRKKETQTDRQRSAPNDEGETESFESSLICVI